MSETYSRSVDFTSGLDNFQLIKEIEKEVGIVPIVKGMTENGDDVIINFSVGLSVGEKTLLDTIVSNHAPNIITGDDWNFGGDYDGSKNYVPGVVVEHDNAYYICILQTENFEDPTNATYWTRFNFGEQERYVTVGQGGGQYTTIAAALVDINAGTIAGGVPTAANPAVIVVYPGTYNEANPIVIPSYVTLDIATSGRSGSSGSVNITPATSTTTSIITLSSFSNVTGVLVRGANGSGGSGIYAPPGTTNVNVTNCIVEDCETGYSIVGSGAPLSTIIFSTGSIARGTATTTLTNGFHVSGGAYLIGSGMAASANPSGTPITNGFVVSGAYSNIKIGTVFVQICFKGFVSMGGVATTEPKIIVTGGEILNSVTSGIEVGADTVIEMYGVAVSGSVGQDLTLLAASSKFLGSGNKIRNDKIINTSSGTLIGIAISETPGENTVAVQGELTVGDVDLPSESAFGEGDSHTRGMTVFTFDGIATYNDITSNVLLAGDGSTSAAFAGTGVGNILYVGGSKAKFPSVKIETSTGVTPAGSAGLLTFEYWNGVSWTETRLMSSDGNAPYIPRAQNVFDLGPFQYRFGALTGWTANIVNGVNSFWFRFRISSAGMTVIPVLDQVKLGTNRVEINKDGFTEYFGTAETIQRLPFDINWFRPSNNSPSNADVYIQDTVSVGRTENSFLFGALDRSGFLTELPSTIDTSRDFGLRFRYMVTSSIAGNLDLTVRWGYNVDLADDPAPGAFTISSIFTSTIGAPTTAAGLLGTTNTILPVAFNTQDKMLNITFNLDVSMLVSQRNTGSNTGDVLWVTIERNATSINDTYLGNFNLVQCTPFFIKCFDGAYSAI